MIIQHNLTAMNSYRQLEVMTGLNAKSSEKLSSGYKINRAADDAAGLAISEKMRRQIRGIRQGTENVQDGISMCQIGDGALVEVMDMLHRMTELTVKAANDTLSLEDRQHIQAEIRQILAEISRIEDTTKFNEQKIFGSGESVITNPDGTPYIEGDIPYESFSFADVNVNSDPPFLEGSTANVLRLQAIVDDPESAADGNRYNLIFGNGSTSYPSVRFGYDDNGTTRTVEANLASSSFTISDYTNNNGTVSRKLTYDNNGISFAITQTATPNADEKEYDLAYSIENLGNTELDMEFMFHVDTAYNNNDRCESYYTGGSRIGSTCVYKSSDYLTDLTGANVYSSIPSSFSIINKDEALAFSEKITFDGVTPDMLSIGQYSAIHSWSYYDSASNLGTSTQGMDLGFSAVWQKENIGQGETFDFSFSYGIAATDEDSNLNPDEITRSDSPAVIITEEKKFWIQASSNRDDGMYLHFGKIDLDTLSIRDLNVLSHGDSVVSLDRTKMALVHVSNLRSKIGAQQNRLEHILKNNANSMENTQSAESLIRDTDMAAEMVKYSNQNILAQAGQSMLVQANQTPQGVLSLLQ